MFKLTRQTALAALKKDPVLWAALVLAVASAFAVPPSAAYVEYLDLRVLALLLGLMLVVAGLKKAGVFTLITNALLRRVHTARALAQVLVGVCFFTSMLITNDVALITFVPLAILILNQTGLQKLLIPVVVLQTVAANLGSSLTPLGNPQNLYLYSLSGMGAGEFLSIMLLPVAVSFGMLMLSLLLIPKEKVQAPAGSCGEKADVRRAVLWAAMFGLCLLTVLHVVHYAAALVVVLAAAVLYDRSLLPRADYGLLLTFVFFFVFIGNIKNIPAVSGLLQELVAGREMMAGVVLSQIISNVPAAMLLSGFTADYAALLLGVNLGGLGTLIASMASMISYKAYAATPGAKVGRYLAVFTGVNFGYLAVLLAVMHFV